MRCLSCEKETDLAECFRTEAQCEDGQEVSCIQKGAVLIWVLSVRNISAILCCWWLFSLLPTTTVQ